jgi:hypothetical protein
MFIRLIGPQNMLVLLKHVIYAVKLIQIGPGYDCKTCTSNGTCKWCLNTKTCVPGGYSGCSSYPSFCPAGIISVIFLF